MAVYIRNYHTYFVVDLLQLSINSLYITSLNVLF